jgi:hypothetical protein
MCESMIHWIDKSRMSLLNEQSDLLVVSQLVTMMCFRLTAVKFHHWTPWSGNTWICHCIVLTYTGSCFTAWLTNLLVWRCLHHDYYIIHWLHQRVKHYIVSPETFTRAHEFNECCLTIWNLSSKAYSVNVLCLFSHITALLVCTCTIPGWTSWWTKLPWSPNPEITQHYPSLLHQQDIEIEHRCEM